MGTKIISVEKVDKKFLDNMFKSEPLKGKERRVYSDINLPIVFNYIKFQY